MHMSDLTIENLKNTYAEYAECANMCRAMGKHYQASKYERQAAAMLARINELEAACGGRCNAEYNPCHAHVEADKLKKETP